VRTNEFFVSFDTGRTVAIGGCPGLLAVSVVLASCRGWKLFAHASPRPRPVVGRTYVFYHRYECVDEQ
jgi:hypothetical protein